MVPALWGRSSTSSWGRAQHWRCPMGSRFVLFLCQMALSPPPPPRRRFEGSHLPSDLVFAPQNSFESHKASPSAQHDSAQPQKASPLDTGVVDCRNTRSTFWVFNSKILIQNTLYTKKEKTHLWYEPFVPPLPHSPQYSRLALACDIKSNRKTRSPVIKGACISRVSHPSTTRLFKTPRCIRPDKSRNPHDPMHQAHITFGSKHRSPSEHPAKKKKDYQPKISFLAG